MRHNFTTLEEARAVTHQTNEYGQEVRVDLFSEQVKNREVDLDQYQRIDSNAAKSAVQAPYVGKSNISYRFEGGVSRYNIEPIPVPYLHRLCGRSGRGGHPGEPGRKSGLCSGKPRADHLSERRCLPEGRYVCPAAPASMWSRRLRSCNAARSLTNFSSSFHLHFFFEGEEVAAFRRIPFRDRMFFLSWIERSQCGFPWKGSWGRICSAGADKKSAVPKGTALFAQREYLY